MAQLINHPFIPLTLTSKTTVLDFGVQFFKKNLEEFDSVVCIHLFIGRDLSSILRMDRFIFKQLKFLAYVL